MMLRADDALHEITALLSYSLAALERRKCSAARL
jgi:hypothetical protein